MNLQTLSEYLDYLEVEKGLSNNTLDAYRRDLSAFIDLCEAAGAKELQNIQRTRRDRIISGPSSQ